ncbi:Uncharacterised protein [Vibrio cholerae]|nr:Uncharacterised protein [Vibrio cholerae]CSH90854.1 Uncharacterised protein [Vibrio cholerae]
MFNQGFLLRIQVNKILSIINHKPIKIVVDQLSRATNQKGTEQKYTKPFQHKRGPFLITLSFTQ